MSKTGMIHGSGLGTDPRTILLLGSSDDIIKKHLKHDLLTEEEEVGGRVANELDERFPHHLQLMIFGEHSEY